MSARYLVSPRGGRRGHRDISSALAAAAAQRRPALIEIEPGHYEEALAVRGEVRLVATAGPGSVLVSAVRGTVLDACGSVSVHGLMLTGRDPGADVVACTGGTLALDHAEVRGHHAVSVHARPHTTVTLRDSTVLYGRTLFTGSRGLVERCRFTDAADNALAVIEGADVAIRDSRIDGSRIHGVRVSDARAQVTGCELTGIGQAALAADTRARLTVSGCTVTAVHAEGILFTEQAKGSVDGTRVTDAQHGVAVASGADLLVRGCVFADCRDSGINVHTAGRGRFEDCEVLGSGTLGVFSTTGGVIEADGVRIARGNVGIAVTDGGRGRFGRIAIEDLTGTALRVFGDARAVFTDVRVDRCKAGLEGWGGAGTAAEVTGSTFRDLGTMAVAVAGQARVALTGVTAERAVLAFGVGEEAWLSLRDCTARELGAGGAIAFGQGQLVARDLTVAGARSYGLAGRDRAYVDVARGTFTDCAAAGASFEGTCAGRMVDCAVEGDEGLAVLDNGHVDLTGLRTTLRVVAQPAEPAGPAPTVVNHFNGPVFNAAVHGAQLAWNNTHAVQQQTNEEGPGP
ncbi:right-handed parallel beta-helix repeat-containing protein [Streptomyces subrutilus]|uniref:Right-handed parallel beta-helix repeat-containing protein n=1 Tax=Streptomyces subrutilus TaxID=36818 RepID=A0A5P2UDE2_9ACTN|nr:right-handed parallel beta-helix repeat-containing protein [Streptomyces subrutilus]QEU77232.1 right-handed parallel beta-helix repeat-containing protein [Streptomyces subrutilus]WSJ33789.1 right-handed parallel beta-helix repeat-containing protein [Streptomyces subrutilus]GGZ45751.1 hypothetical protein GCM10010371_00920 [Streptomyces subrutilus]